MFTFLMVLVKTRRSGLFIKLFLIAEHINRYKFSNVRNARLACSDFDD